MSSFSRGAQIFLSYKREHPETAEAMEPLVERLRKEGYEPYIDERSVEMGPWDAQLYEALLHCQGAIIFASRAARDESVWCRREWEILVARATASRLPVIPILVDDFSGGELASLPFTGLQSFPAGEKGIEDKVIKMLEEVVPPHEIGMEDYLVLHHAWVRYQFRSSPALGQENFTLADIYQETECGDLAWGDLSHDRTDPEKDKIDPEKEKHGGRENAIAAACKYLLDPDFRKEPIVVRGPAGAGKSSFSLRLAQELMDSHGLSPIFIRFRNLTLTRLQSNPIEEILSGAVRTGPDDDIPPSLKDFLINDELLRQEAESVPGMCRHVFILDGWDEVALTGTQSYQQQLEVLLPKLRDYFFRRPGLKIGLVLTGRPSVEVGSAGILHANSRVLTLRPLRPKQLTDFSRSLMESSEHWELTEEKANEAISVYEKWFDKRNEESVPDELRSFEMMGLPLLGLLTFRTIAGYDGPISKLLEEPAALYKALVDQTVEHHGQAQEVEGLEDAARIPGAELRKLLQQTAAMISILEGETITYEELDARLKEESDGDLQETVRKCTDAKPLSNLVINFYFKGGKTDLGCEFLHKSFREYFFAEAIFSLLKRFAEENPVAPRLPDLKYWEDFPVGSAQYRLSRSLSRLFAPQWQKPEERRNLFWLLQSDIQEDPERWIGLRDLLAEVYGWWAEGVHLRMPREKRLRIERFQLPYIDELMQWSHPLTSDAIPMRSTTLDGHLGDALMQLTALVHWELRNVSKELPTDRVGHTYQSWSQDEKFCRFRPGGKDRFMRSIIGRIDAVGRRPDGERLFKAFMDGIDLSGERMQLEIFGLTTFVRANLSGANLYGAYFREANLCGAQLLKANLPRANFTGRVNLVGANLSRARLLGANLREAKLIEADLSRTYLVDANLIRANLTDADLSGADLGRANLRGAILSGAKLIGANLRGADLSTAYLRETDFNKARQIDKAIGIPKEIVDQWKSANKSAS
ncbi:MAG: hypothetical protein CMO55_20765 [Verrucomicrobiales bacterium]|nr:hypothetical protein [Verrucomicrobiales bacterium]